MKRFVLFWQKPLALKMFWLKNTSWNTMQAGRRVLNIWHCALVLVVKVLLPPRPRTWRWWELWMPPFYKKDHPQTEIVHNYSSCLTHILCIWVILGTVNDRDIWAGSWLGSDKIEDSTILLFRLSTEHITYLCYYDRRADDWEIGLCPKDSRASHPEILPDTASVSLIYLQIRIWYFPALRRHHDTKNPFIDYEHESCFATSQFQNCSLSHHPVKTASSCTYCSTPNLAFFQAARSSTINQQLTSSMIFRGSCRDQIWSLVHRSQRDVIFEGI